MPAGQQKIILIAAMAANRVIGREKSIPWNISGEQARFKEITMGHTLIMGRKAWQSIGHPLPGRRNIVMTRNPAFQAYGAGVAHSLEDAFALCTGDDKIFIIGGEQLYRMTLPVATSLILTILPEPVVGDAYFPEFSDDDFRCTSVEQINSPEPYSIHIFQRNNQ